MRVEDIIVMEINYQLCKHTQNLAILHPNILKIKARGIADENLGPDKRGDECPLASRLKGLRAHPQVILAPAVHRKRLAVADVVDKQRDVFLQKLNGLRPKPAKPSHSQNSVMPILYPLLFG